MWVAPSHKFIPELACLKVLGRFQILILQNPTTLNFYSISCSINIMMIFFFLRGRHGIVRRVLDKFTGSQYAAKFIFVCDEHQKRFFRTELNILRWLNQRGVPKVVDAFVTERRIVIITEMYPWFDHFTSSQRYFDYNTYFTYILSKLFWLLNILLFLKDKLRIYYIIHVVRSCIAYVINSYSLLIKLTVRIH